MSRRKKKKKQQQGKNTEIKHEDAKHIHKKKSK